MTCRIAQTLFKGKGFREIILRINIFYFDATLGKTFLFIIHKEDLVKECYKITASIFLLHNLKPAYYFVQSTFLVVH